MCRIGKSAADMMHVLQTVVYGDNALNKKAVCDWYSHFKSGQEMLGDEPCLAYATHNTLKPVPTLPR
jgi:hypothetical protein